MGYFDAAATTPVRRAVLEAMWPYLTGEFGNPSSQNALGLSAATALDDARRTVAAHLGCKASEVVFTSGGTEADNLALKGIALGNPRGRHIITSAIEHEAVLESCDYLARHHGFEITLLPVDEFGSVSVDSLAAALRPDSTLVSIMYANNEVGTVQPITELAAVARAAGVPFHSDAVQAAGALGISIADLGIDAISIAGHKLGAPKGIGALAVRARLPLEPLLHGGGQQRGIRSGTENIAGAVGLAAALTLAVAADRAAQTVLRDRLIAGVLAVDGAQLTGHPSARLPAHASFCFPGMSGESIVVELEQRGVIVSSGSACAAGRDEPSHVLLAMGLTAELAQSSVRFSFGDDVTTEDVDEAVTALGEAVAAVRALASR